MRTASIGSCPSSFSNTWSGSPLSFERAEDHRVLRTGGRFYLSELHPYRQFEEIQAHFEDETTGETVVIDASTHPVSAFINAGIEAGFAVEEVGEWRAKGDEQPRLLTIRPNAGPAAACS